MVLALLFWLCGHDVPVVNNYADTDKTTWTLSVNFEGFSQILKEQSGEKRYFVVFTNPIAIIKKIWKCPYVKKNVCIRVVNDYADTQFSNFAIEYLHENEKLWESAFACSYGGAQVESFKQKNGRKSRDTVCEYCIWEEEEAEWGHDSKSSANHD